MWASGPCQTTVQAADENVPARPTTPTNADADAQNSGSRSSLAGGTLRVGSPVATVACTGDSLRQPYPGTTLKPIHRSAWNRNSRKFISKILHSPAPVGPVAPLLARRQ